MLLVCGRPPPDWALQGRSRIDDVTCFRPCWLAWANPALPPIISARAPHALPILVMPWSSDCGDQQRPPRVTRCADLTTHAQPQVTTGNSGKRHQLCKQEVDGSIPSGSIIAGPSCSCVGMPYGHQNASSARVLRCLPPAPVSWKQRRDAWRVSAAQCEWTSRPTEMPDPPGRRRSSPLELRSVRIRCYRSG